MTIIHSDSIFKLEPGVTPDYNRGNSLLQVMKLMEKIQFAAGREYYLQNTLQFLIPFQNPVFYPPQGHDNAILDPTQQDNKTDFQKQNLKSFETTDTLLVRGLITISEWTGPFLKLSYSGSPDSKLSHATNHNLGESIYLWLKIGQSETGTFLKVPYNHDTDNYEIEIWGYPHNDFENLIDDKIKKAIQQGSLLIDHSLVQGSADDFAREKVHEQNLLEVAVNNLMHPILPLHLELAWTTNDQSEWDSNNGNNYHYEFNMVLRGWDNYLSVGISPNPHGGIGFLEYRNLLSNYGQFANSNELGRKLEDWNFNAFGQKQMQGEVENFFAVDYMDLHIMKGNAGIGLHRHRDNQEVFLMMDGDGSFMVVGDWCKMPNRERCMEVRTLLPGHMAMLKGGQLHGLMNATDADVFLFMFGGYD